MRRLISAFVMATVAAAICFGASWVGNANWRDVAIGMTFGMVGSLTVAFYVVLGNGTRTA